jgi:hypothetical protein
VTSITAATRAQALGLQCPNGAGLRFAGREKERARVSISTSSPAQGEVQQLLERLVLTDRDVGIRVTVCLQGEFLIDAWAGPAEPGAPHRSMPGSDGLGTGRRSRGGAPLRDDVAVNARSR